MEISGWTLVLLHGRLLWQERKNAFIPPYTDRTGNPTCVHTTHTHTHTGNVTTWLKGYIFTVWHVKVAKVINYWLTAYLLGLSLPLAPQKLPPELLFFLNDTKYSTNTAVVVLLRLWFRQKQISVRVHVSNMRQVNDPRGWFRLLLLLLLLHCAEVEQWAGGVLCSSGGSSSSVGRDKEVGGAPNRACRLASSHTHRSSLRLLSCELSRLTTQHSS